MRIVRTQLPLLMACLALFVGGSASARTTCQRVIAVGDLHGTLEALETVLEQTGLIDDQWRWLDQEACLVQLGDIFDRGPHSRRILDLLMNLERQAPGRVTVLLGNHETMNLTGDRRYVHPLEYAAFAEEETGEDRDQGLEWFRRIELMRDLDEDELTATFDATFPPGWFARRRALSSEGRYGAWLLDRPAAIRINATLYLHGGMSRRDASAGLKKLNRQFSRELNRAVRHRELLVREGWLNPLLPEADAQQNLRHVIESVGQVASGDTTRIAAAAREYLSLYQGASFARMDGPLWNRELAALDEPSLDAMLEPILDELNVARIVAAHTPMADGRIRSRSDLRVFLIDTGANPHYQGQASALEIRDNGTIRAVYPDWSEILAGPDEIDLETEQALLRANIVETEEIGSGTTRPLRVLLERNGKKRFAAFKYLDKRRPGMSTLSNGRREMNFTDSYRYERAAYLLDRRLGLHMVPVVVSRPIDGTAGVLVDWVVDSMSEAERAALALEPPNARRWKAQQAMMEVFDALIFNIDRNAENQLITVADWNLHLIDHSLGFRNDRKPPQSFLDSELDPPAELLYSLETLGAAELEELLGALLSRQQIRALLSRRDAILKRLREDGR